MIRPTERIPKPCHRARLPDLFLYDICDGPQGIVKLMLYSINKLACFTKQRIARGRLKTNDLSFIVIIQSNSQRKLILQCTQLEVVLLTYPSHHNPLREEIRQSSFMIPRHS